MYIYIYYIYIYIYIYTYIYTYIGIYRYIYIYNIYIYIYTYIYIYDSQIVYRNPCFNLFILHNIPFDNQGGKINKNDIFLRFDILSFTKYFFLLPYILIYI